jgi:DNA invertase Pin-like site-specific DNA recombinase
MMPPLKRRRAYARVSTIDQTLALQRDGLKLAG